MAELDARQDGTATEAPTPRRREQAREQGQVPFSQELASGGQLAAAWLVLYLCGPTILSGLAETLLTTTRRPALQEFAVNEAVEISRSLAESIVACTGLPLVCLLMGGLLLSLSQMGWQVTLQPIRLHWERLDISRGFQKLLTWNTSVRGLWTIVRLSAFTALLIWCLWGSWQQISYAGTGRPLQLLLSTWEMSLSLLGLLAGTSLVVGCADYGVQWYRHEQQLRMTREELKQEIKEEQGDPHLKSLARRRQREQIKQRSIKDVPKAAVVITNPTHIAVALRYDWGRNETPVVLAKGTGELAQRIKSLALKHHIHTVENKPLARGLYKNVQIGQQIPADFYRAIAEILSQLHQHRGL